VSAHCCTLHTVQHSLATIPMVTVISLDIEFIGKKIIAYVQNIHASHRALKIHYQGGICLWNVSQTTSFSQAWSLSYSQEKLIVGVHSKLEAQSKFHTTNNNYTSFAYSPSEATIHEAVVERLTTKITCQKKCLVTINLTGASKSWLCLK